MNNDLISRSELKKAIEQGEGFSWDSLGKDDLCVRKKYIDNAPTVELFCAYLSDGEVRQPCLEAPCKHERPQEEKQYTIKVNVPEDIRDKLIEELSKPRKVILDEHKTVTDCIIAYGDGFESARRLFERPHGEWIFNNKWQDYECNKCHDWVRIRHGELPNFCGNCGANMRKGKEE